MSRIDDLINAKKDLEDYQLKLEEEKRLKAEADELALLEKLRPVYAYILAQLGLGDLPAEYGVRRKYNQHFTHDVTVKIEDWILFFYLTREDRGYMKLSIEIQPAIELIDKEKEALRSAWGYCRNNAYVLIEPAPDWLVHNDMTWGSEREIRLMLQRVKEKSNEVVPENSPWLSVKALIGQNIQELQACLDSTAIYELRDTIRNILKERNERDALMRESMEAEESRRRAVIEAEQEEIRMKGRLARIRREEEQLAAEWAEEIREEQEIISHLQSIQSLWEKDRDSAAAMYYVIDRIIARKIKDIKEGCCE